MSKKKQSVCAISQLAELNPHVELNKLNEDAEISFIPMSDVSDSGRWFVHQTRLFREVKTGYTVFQEGDVLFAKITPCMENGKGCHAVGLTNGIGFGSTEFHVLRAKPHADPRFLFHLIQSKTLRLKAAAKMTGSAGQQRVPSSFFCEYLVIELNRQEQTQIAAILSCIDQAIEQTEALIAKHQRIKTGLMQDLLTKGIDEHGNIRSEETHEFKDSPLGRIPKEWSIVPLLSFAAKGLGTFVNGPFGSDLLTSELHNEGIPVIYVRDIKAGVYQQTSDAYVTEAKADQLHICNVRKGDVLVAKVGNPPCDAAVYPFEQRAIITQDVIRIRLANNIVPYYLSNLINSSIGRRIINNIIIEGTRARVSLTEFKDLQLPKPSKAEQEKIIQSLEAYETLISKASIYLSKLRKLKSGLMQDLLTGKVNVESLLLESSVISE
jgi:type I restriction enzyme, S subunit